jgi:hypothetical protein
MQHEYSYTINFYCLNVSSSIKLCQSLISYNFLQDAAVRTQFKTRRFLMEPHRSAKRFIIKISLLCPNLNLMSRCPALGDAGTVTYRVMQVAAPSGSGEEVEGISHIINPQAAPLTRLLHSQPLQRGARRLPHGGR